ncbi:MAG: hypothetical protein ACKOCX_12970 [Planctomycetota bacterium]
MLRKNPLQPPRPYSPASTPGLAATRPAATGFVVAEDFDGTGIMAGVDTSESRYWWIPELYGPDDSASGPAAQAATGSLTRTTAAA